MPHQRTASALQAPRSDARRNRRTILRVAEEAFAHGSGLVTLDEIARRAGLGRATVYRHFSNRRSLGTAVANQQLKSMREFAGAEPDFRDVLHTVLSALVARRPLVQLFRGLPDRDQRQYADALIGALTPAFHRAQARGELRDNVEPADLRRLLHMVEASVVAGSADAEHDPGTQRLIAVVLDGLFRPPTPK